MVVQAIALLDDLDKEINIYAMRVKVRNTYRFCEQDAYLPFRSGMVGISPKWPRSYPTTLPMPK